MTQEEIEYYLDLKHKFNLKIQEELIRARDYFNKRRVELKHVHNEKPVVEMGDKRYLLFVYTEGDKIEYNPNHLLIKSAFYGTYGYSESHEREVPLDWLRESTYKDAIDWYLYDWEKENDFQKALV